MSIAERPVAVLMMAMGGPDCLENVEAYLRDVRGGRPTSLELVEEIRQRYRGTGGKSPVLRITPDVARALEQRYQSQGRSGEHWLGPSVEETLSELAHQGHRQVLVAPIGFIWDPVETLYDIDFELNERAQVKGVQLERIPRLNASAALIDILTLVFEAHESSLVH